MKKLIVLVLFLLAVNSVLALDCQYTAKKEIKIPTNVIYENGTKTDYSLVVDNFIRHNKQGSQQNTEIHSFRVTNNYDHQLDVTVTFINHGEADSEDLIIDPGGYNTVDRPANDPTSIDENGIMFLINDASLNVTKGYISKFEDICAECPPGSGFPCIGDGNPSPSDEKCGSGRRNVLGVCVCRGCPIPVSGDGNCSMTVGENCKNSGIDCACGNNTVCSVNGDCIIDCANPPAGKACCSVNSKDVFRSTKVNDENLPCDCDFECKDGLSCRTNKCVSSEKIFCPETNSYESVASVELNTPCGCDFQCKQGVCFQEKCQKLIDPNIKCPSGTNVQKGKPVQCNIYGSNIKLGKDVKLTFTLEVDSGLSFSSSQGCQNAPGSQCIGNYIVADLSNEGIAVQLESNSEGDSRLEGKVTFDYKGKKVEEKVSPVAIHIGECGDKHADFWETKENCCLDVGVANYSFLSLQNEKCENNVFTIVYNWPLISIMAVFVLMALVAGFRYVKENKIHTLNGQIRNLNDEIQGKRTELENLNDSIDNGASEITSIKDQLMRAVGAAKEKFEAELSKQEALQKERKRKLEEAKAALDTEDEELNAKYRRALQTRYTMKINEKGYPVFADNPKNLIHRNVYQHAYKKKYNKEFDRSQHIHHIDNNKLNSLNFWNLIDITEAQHHRIIHGKITRGDWEQGVKVMMEALGWDETDLPDHIREHIRC
jgi:hypothetical protein